MKTRDYDEYEEGAAGIVFFIVCGILGWFAGLAIALGTNP